MDKFRSKSYRESNNGGPTSMQGMRSYSVNYAEPTQVGKEIKMKRVKSNGGSRRWTMGDAELQRKKRVAGYKAYGMEGKMKGNLRKSLRWIKDAYSQVIYGWK